jgi:hypothetical protein
MEDTNQDVQEIDPPVPFPLVEAKETESQKIIVLKMMIALLF